MVLATSRIIHEQFLGRQVQYVQFLMTKGPGFLDLLEASIPGQIARTIAISMRLASISFAT